MDKARIQKLTEVARSAIKDAYGTEDDEFGATLFVSHHREEIAVTYWEKQFGTSTPEPSQILDSLVLRSDFDEGEEDDEIATLDFTLPGDVTNYVLCVTFNEDGEVEDLSMES